MPLDVSAILLIRGYGRYWLPALLAAFLVLPQLSCRPSPKLPQDRFNDSAAKIHVRQDGFQRITLEAVRATGMKIDEFAYDSVRLSHEGRPVSYHISDEVLIFWGQSSDDRYVPTRTYLLETGKAGLAMAELPSAASSPEALNRAIAYRRIHLEENVKYLAESVDTADADPWFWQTLGQNEKLAFTVRLPQAVDEAATLRMRLWGRTHNPEVINDHDFDLFVNGQNLGALRWEGQTSYVGHVDIPSKALKAGENEITLDNQVAGASFLDVIELDWLELEFPINTIEDDEQISLSNTGGETVIAGLGKRPWLFDLGSADDPKILTEWSYDEGRAVFRASAEVEIFVVGADGFIDPESIEPVRASTWSDPSNRADLIILTTSELAAALRPLAEGRRAQGVQGVIVPISEVYDEFGYGIASPESIRRFVAFAHENWQTPRPSYLLIVGDATADYRDYLGRAPENLVPSPMIPVAYGGETVSDARLADIDDDHRPDIAIGRWPVDSVDDVESLVQRTLAYENGDAAASSLFAADGSESQFADMVERVWASAGFPNEQAELIIGANASSMAEKWNDGAWLVTYVGHGSVQRWGKDDVFSVTAVDELHADTPPIVLQLTCLSGLFAHPEITSLSETMMRYKRGPVILVAATSLTLSQHQEPFASALLRELSDPDVTRIGDAFKRAKMSLEIETNSGLREVSDTFVLLGDPSALIVRPPS